MTGCTEFRQSGPCLIAWQGPTPVARIAWDAAESGWYVNFLFVEQPHLLAPLLSKFRKLWRSGGKPTLSFHASPDNQVIGRLIGSGLVDQSQKMTVAARAMADKKTVGHLS